MFCGALFGVLPNVRSIFSSRILPGCVIRSFDVLRTVFAHCESPNASNRTFDEENAYHRA
jgi:hypothetical protein